MEFLEGFYLHQQKNTVVKYVSRHTIRLRCTENGKVELLWLLLHFRSCQLSFGFCLIDVF